MKKTISVLLLTLLLGSCNTNVTNSDSNSESSEKNSISDFSESSLATSTESSLSSESSNSSILSSSEQINSATTPFYKEKNVTHFLGSDNDVYRINITTQNNEFPVDKTNYIVGNLNVSEQDSSNVILPNMAMKVKLRGNSTMVADKKPFKIKFNEKQSLFDLPAAKEWVLLANYYDKSNIRNYLAYLTANKLNHLNYQPSSIFVDVYFNNEYQGLYLLCEQIEMKAGRVAINKNFSVDGISSFLLEADERAKEEYAGYQGSCYVTSGGYDFALKDPDPDDYIEALETLNSETATALEKNVAQQTVSDHVKNVTWLQKFMDETSESIYTKTNYTNYIDVDSFIDYYLVAEFFKNVDVGSTSQFYYIDQGQKDVKLSAGPVWDFDIGAGVVDETSSDIYAGYYAITDLFVRSRDYYLKALFEDPVFEEKVQQRYKEVREDVFLAVFDEMELALDTLNNALTRNINKWPLTNERKTWVEMYALSERYYSLTTITQHNKLLYDFLTKRLEVLDDTYLK